MSKTLFYIALDDTVASGITMFCYQAVKDPLGSVVLLAPVLFILIQPSLNDRFERIQFRGFFLDNRWCR